MTARPPAATHVPVVDISDLTHAGGDSRGAAQELGAACREHGFFYISGHGVDPGLIERLRQLSRQFFALPLPEKQRLAMRHGGKAWRGYFSVGEELTSGKPDQKEGLYFGSELPPDHPEVLAGTPLHGPNLFPEIPGFRDTLLAYLSALTEVGHAVMAGLSLSLGLPADYFRSRYTDDPLILFRIFNYPVSRSASPEPTWGVGEHTDYGLLTILWQDEVGGLQVKSRDTWIAAPYLPGTFICNIGDMLDRLTRGLYRSTPHRVSNTSARDRLSLPFFFDPNFRAQVQPIEELANVSVPDDRAQRWDRASVHEPLGTYGDYLLNKVAKVFPELKRDVL